MIRPWYRSRLFWLGLAGLVFMLWLWLAKADQSFFFGHNAITGPNEETTRSIGSFDSSIFLSTSINHHHGGARVLGFRGFKEALDPDDPVIYFPIRPFGSISKATYLGYTHAIWLAWWAVITAYTAIWLGAVAGWQRRKGRLSRRAAAELPGS